MKKKELRVAIQEMDTYQFGLKNELHNKLTKVTSYIPKKEAVDLIGQLEEPDLTVEYRKGYEQGVLNAIQTANESKLVEIPQFVAEVIKKYKENDDSLCELLASVEHANIKYYNGMEKNRVAFNTCYEPSVDLCETIARAWLDGYIIIPERNMQVTIKSYDQTESEFEIPESEAKKIIEELRCKHNEQ